MATLPQLIEEDILQMGRILQDLLTNSEATTALVIDKGGFLITNRGDSDQFDLTTISALASGAYLANQTIANLVHEENFDSVYQQGEKHSMLVMNIDEHCLLVVIFRAIVSVGAVKYFGLGAVPKIGRQLKTAQERDPEGGLDLSVLNVANPSELFRRKTA
jgi:predicted regulator of Ras-like GTPase activity (Roadblock/LC7/MglB family)